MKHGHKYSEEDILELLKEKKLSVTGPRKLILKLLTAEHGPYTADEIFQKQWSIAIIFKRGISSDEFRDGNFRK